MRDGAAFATPRTARVPSTAALVDMKFRRVKGVDTMPPCEMGRASKKPPDEAACMDASLGDARATRTSPAPTGAAHRHTHRHHGLRGHRGVYPTRKGWRPSTADPPGQVMNGQIDTQRLILEPLVERHADVLFEGLSDARLYEFTDDKPPANLSTLRARFHRLESRHSPDGSE